MKFDDEALFGGGLSWGNISTSELARKSDVHKGTLSRMFAGQEGLSVASARKVAETMEASPVALFVGTQALATKNASESGAITTGQVLRGIARITDGLGNFSPAERAGSSEVVEKAMGMLWDLADEARGATPESGSLDALGRTGTGLKAVKQYNPSAPEEPITPAKKSERPRRNVDGTSRMKIM